MHLCFERLPSSVATPTAAVFAFWLCAGRVSDCEDMLARNAMQQLHNDHQHNENTHC